MKKILKIQIILVILFLSSLSLASYITRETGGKYEVGIHIRFDNQFLENQIFYDIPVGILVWSSNNHIINCTFINCSDEGILLVGDNNTIENCVFYNCCDGIELQKSSNNTFINCRFLSNYHAGIDAIKTDNNNNLFYNCLFYDNSPYGCYFHESKNNKFINCEFIENKNDIKEVP